MRSIYSELILRPSLIICVFGSLSGCSDKAYQSAVYTDPGREKHARTSEKAETAKSAKSNKAHWDAVLKGAKDAPAPTPTPVAPPTPATTPVPPTVVPETNVTAKPSDFETSRSKSRRSANKLADKPATTTKEAPKAKADKSSAAKKPFQLNFTTESVEGLIPAEVLKSLVSVPNMTSDRPLNLETLNQGSFHIEFTPREDMNDRYDAVAALTLIVQTENDDPDADSYEVVKTLRLTNLGNVIGNSGSYEALLQLRSKRFVRVKIGAKNGSEKRSGQILLVQDDGSEKKILTLIQEK